MFVDFGGVRLLLLTAVVFARAQVTLTEDAISRSEKFDGNDKQDGIYRNTKNYPAGLVDNHDNFKPRKIRTLLLDENSAQGVNSKQNYKTFGTAQGSSSDHNNEAALGDGAFEFSAQDKELFDNQAELHENPLKPGVQGENESPSATVDADGVVRKKKMFQFEFNYTIDVSDMSLACQDGRVNFTDSANQLVLATNHVLRISQALLKKYVNWAYNTSWEVYSLLIHEDLDAPHVPLLPMLPKDFNHSVIKSKKPTTPPPNEPGPDTGTPLDTVTSLDQVLRDTYSVMELCKAATDSVLLEQALSCYPLISDLQELNGRFERVLGVLWNLLTKCNVDPNPEPLQHILESVYERETVDDIKRRGLLTIFHTERALNYVKHILKEINPSLG